MKKLIALSLPLALFLTSFGQQSTGIDFSDSSFNYYGIWSANKIYGSKDSISPGSLSYFRVYTSKFQANSLNYLNSTGTPTNVAWADDSGIVKKSPLSSLNPTIRGAVSAGTGISYNSSTGVITNSAPAVAFAPTVDTLSASRTFGTAYQMSTTKYVEVKISATISCNLSLTGGGAGTISLDTSPNGTTWTSHGQINNSNTGSLTIGLNTTQVSGGQISALLPPGYYWRASTSSATGTPTYTMLQGEKVTY